MRFPERLTDRIYGSDSQWPGSLLVLTQSFAQAPSLHPRRLLTPAIGYLQEGKDIGGFHVTQSIEFGGRITDSGAARRCMTPW